MILGVLDLVTLIKSEAYLYQGLSFEGSLSNLYSMIPYLAEVATDFIYSIDPSGEI
jgi:hypothetical protein